MAVLNADCVRRCIKVRWDKCLMCYFRFPHFFATGSKHYLMRRRRRPRAWSPALAIVIPVVSGWFMELLGVFRVIRLIGFRILGFRVSDWVAGSRAYCFGR